jgi:hypothetical protein
LYNQANREFYWSTNYVILLRNEKNSSHSATDEREALCIFQGGLRRRMIGWFVCNCCETVALRENFVDRQVFQQNFSGALQFRCYVFKCFTSRSRICHLYGDVTTGRAANFGLCLSLWTLKHWAGTCHICCDIGPRFSRSYPKDLPHFVASYDTLGDAEDPHGPPFSRLTTRMRMPRTYFYADLHGNTHIGTRPLPVKGCKFKHMPSTYKSYVLLRATPPTAQYLRL